MSNCLSRHKKARKRVNWFNADTLIEGFYQRISDEMGFKLFELKINDPYGGFVDFDKGYLKNFRPYATNLQTEHVGPQPTTSTVPTIELKIVNISDHKHNSTVESQRKLSKKSSNIACQLSLPDSIAEQPETERECVSSQTRSSFICAPDSILLDKDKQVMEFKNDLNEIQRDLYKSEKPVSMQADKSRLIGKAVNKSVLPKLKIKEGTIPEEDKSTYNVVSSLVLEVCEDGKRTLYHHPERELSAEKNEKLNESVPSVGDIRCTFSRNEAKQGHVTIPFNNEMNSVEGYEMKWKVIVIPHTKIYTKRHPDQQKHLFCSLQNQHPKGTNYQTTRLAVLLEQDRNLLWDQLVLSKAIVFSKSKDKVIYIIIKDNDGRIIERIPKLEETPKSGTSTTKSKKFKSSNTGTTTLEIDQQTLPVTKMNINCNTTLCILPLTTTMDCIQQQHGDNQLAESIVLNVPSIALTSSSMDYSGMVIADPEYVFNWSDTQTSQTDHLHNCSQRMLQDNVCEAEYTPTINILPQVR
ncbi:hypothetical protein I4U23_031399 [Adineta vaga]|nr:hypothetical protein I4U23_031399 [Adineta vaga]